MYLFFGLRKVNVRKTKQVKKSCLACKVWCMLFRFLRHDRRLRCCQFFEVMSQNKFCETLWAKRRLERNEANWMVQLCRFSISMSEYQLWCAVQQKRISEEKIDQKRTRALRKIFGETHNEIDWECQEFFEISIFGRCYSRRRWRSSGKRNNRATGMSSVKTIVRTLQFEKIAFISFEKRWFWSCVTDTFRSVNNCYIGQVLDDGLSFC